MGNVTNTNSFDSEGCISLYDVWQKVVLYKKTYWVIFFTVFIIGASVALLSPTKYEFTQIFKIGGYINDKGEKIQLMETNGLVTAVKSIYFNKAFHKYNLPLVKKTDPKDYKIEVKDAGDGAFVLSAIDKSANADIYRFIFKEAVNFICDDTRSEVEFRINNLLALKNNLETRLHDIDSFYKEMAAKGFGYSANGFKKMDSAPKPDIASLESKVISMYLNDQQATIISLTNSINMVLVQIDGTYNIKTVTDFTVSDFPVGPSKLQLLILAVIASFFFAFFGVFIVDFVINCNKN